MSWLRLDILFGIVKIIEYRQMKPEASKMKSFCLQTLIERFHEIVWGWLSDKCLAEKAMSN